MKFYSKVIIHIFLFLFSLFLALITIGISDSFHRMGCIGGCGTVSGFSLFLSQITYPINWLQDYTYNILRIFSDDIVSVVKLADIIVISFVTLVIYLLFLISIYYIEYFWRKKSKKEEISVK